MRHHIYVCLGQLGSYNPSCCHCPIPRLLSQGVQFGGLGFVWWKDKVCPYTRCTIAQTLPRKAVDGLDSEGWTKGFRTPCAHQRPSVYIVHTHIKPGKAEEQFLLASWESVLWVLISITHHGAGELWRQSHEEHMPVKCLMGIIKSSAWTAETESWSFLSHHICSEVVQRV